MKTKSTGCLMALAAMFAATASAADVYTVTADVSDLDLTTGAYESDRLMGPAQDKKYTLSGTLTHAPATIASPFLLIGNSANTASKVGELNIDVSSGLDAATPFSFFGYGRFCFNNTYTVGSGWSDSMIQSDGNATGWFHDLRIVSNDITLDGSNPSGLLKLLTGPNPKENNNEQHWGRSIRVGVGDGGSASLTLRNTRLCLRDGTTYLGVDASTDSAAAVVQGALVLDHADFVIWNQDFRSGYGCLDNNGAHRAATNTVTIGAGSRFYVRRAYQQNAPSFRVTFAGGTWECNWDTTTDKLLESSGNGYFFVTNAPGCDFNFDISNPKCRIKLANGSHISIAGDGDFVKSGVGTLYVNAPVRTTGRARVEGGTLAVTANDVLPSVTNIASNAVLDIQGVRQVVQAPWGGGTICSSSATPGTLALVCDENWTLGGVYPNVNLEKRGRGTVTTKGTFGDEITVGEGKLVLGALPAVAKGPSRYWRFKVDGIRGSVNMMQFSEIKLLSSGTNVTGAASVAYDTVHNPEKSNGGKPFSDSERPEKAYDNDTGSKWLDYRAGVNETAEVRDSVWLKFDFGADGVPVTGYEWYTANDEPPRDPVSWRLQRSDDGETWENVDVQTGYDVTTARKALAYRYENTDLTAQVKPLKKITVAPGASLEIDGIDVVAESITAPEGSITLVNGGTLALLVDVDSGDTRTVQLGDTWLPAGAGVEKTGGGTATLTGLSGLSGAVAVEDGELRIAAAPALGDAKYFRFTVKDTYTSEKVFQLSEFSLYDADDNRVNGGLIVTNLAELVAGSAAFDAHFTKNNKYSHNGSEGLDKLFDGSTGTKLCVTDPKPKGESSTNSWCIIVMRLADDANSVASYSFTTANDSTPERSPKTWTLEASVDGSEWVLVDEHVNDTDTPGNTKTESKKYAISLGQSSGASGGSAFAAGSTVSVADGARLVLDDDGASAIYGLSIDAAAGAGTIENFKAAPSGVIYLTNVTNPSSLARSGVDLITFENCPVRPSFAGWTVYVNGQPTSYRVKATDTGLQLSSLGLTIILR